LVATEVTEHQLWLARSSQSTFVFARNRIGLAAATFSPDWTSPEFESIQ
jgi:hypothetical protein